MINHDRFTVTSAQKFYGAQGTPQESERSSWVEPQDWVFDHRTGALTVCQIPPSISNLQDTYGSFNIRA